MKRIVLTVILVLAFVSTHYGYVFINSIPLNANIYLDGELIGTSPLLIKEELTGEHTITYKKADYFDLSTTVNLLGGVTNIYNFITPKTFSIYFPDQSQVLINDQLYGNEQVHSLPDGFYYFQSGTNFVSMRRQNPNQVLWLSSMVLTGFGIASGIIGQISANKAFEQYEAATNLTSSQLWMNRTTFWDNFSGLGWVLSGLGAGATVFFTIDHIRFEKQNETLEIDSVDYSETASSIYEAALDYQTTDNMEKAIEYYTRVIDEYPDSRYNPISLFRRALIYQEQGQDGLAKADLELIKNQYPIFEIYALSIYTLGDIYFEQGKYLKAVESYEDIKHLDDSYASEMDYKIIQSYYQVYLSDPANADTKGTLTGLIQEYLDNSGYPEDYKEEIRALSIS